MISSFFKVLTTIAIISGAFYSASVFGPNKALVAVCILAFAMVLSIFFQNLNSAARILGIGFFILSFLSFLLLMLAATMGGSFNLSPSNENIAIFLVVISLLSSSAFAWSNTKKETT
ncbi:hypothetical protein [Agarilytica rhodophyticola]|uniref:hypothetical protein n=1 Tax=Agarilytica rhodophyticola TaxID=1737490 RepID=UPI000B34815D|nr:hypothetical protein [Agarilytica rhodophyticola]